MYRTDSSTAADRLVSLSLNHRLMVLVVAFLGWLCAGMHMSITQLSGQAAAVDLLARSGSLDAAKYQAFTKQTQGKGSKSQGPQSPLSSAEREEFEGWKKIVAQWFAWYQCAFLFGAASGGLVLGWLGDRVGRAKGMAVSILTYSLMAGAAYFSQSPEQLLVLWFLACVGVGGMWPNGVALISEVWSGLSKPLVAGVIGTAANVGLFLMATLATWHGITFDDWRWVMLVGASPAVIGLWAWFMVPESPHWLALRGAHLASPNARPSLGEVFHPPLLQITLVGIVLATIPLIGGWGSANWMNPWADEAGVAASPPNPYLKAQVGQARALTGIAGSLLGGWMASMVGRRLSFFLTSLAALGLSQYIFRCMVPTDRLFLTYVAALGFVSGLYFGWLPLFLPELFPTRVRSTGAGVSFNFGRIVTAVTIFTTGALMQYFKGDYPRIGQVTSMIFAVGMVAVCFAPDTSRRSEAATL